jgi:hypothetical protein
MFGCKSGRKGLGTNVKEKHKHKRLNYALSGFMQIKKMQMRNY